MCSLQLLANSNTTSPTQICLKPQVACSLFVCLCVHLPCRLPSAGSGAQHICFHSPTPFAKNHWLLTQVVPGWRCKSSSACIPMFLIKKKTNYNMRSIVYNDFLYMDEAGIDVVRAWHPTGLETNSIEVVYSTQG